MNGLLTKVLDAHGGLERWRSYNMVSWSEARDCTTSMRVWMSRGYLWRQEECSPLAFSS